MDGTFLREKARRDYDKVSQNLEKAREDLQHFKGVIKPEFERWMHRHFGAELSQVRELQREVQEKGALLAEVEREVFLAGLEPHEAYAKVMRRRKGLPNEEDSTGGNRENQREAGAEEFWNDDFAEGEGDEEQQAREFFDSLFGEGAFDEARRKEEWEGGSRAGRMDAGRSGGRDPVTGKRLKELYRALARRLHPDAGGGHCRKAREKWHEVQEAYEKGDVEKLEVLLTLCEFDEKGDAAHASVGLMMRMLRQLRKTLRQVRAELRKCKEDPAWLFHTPGGRKRLQAELESEFAESLDLLRYDLNRLNREIQKLEKRSSSRRARRRRRRSVFFEMESGLFEDDDDCPF